MAWSLLAHTSVKHDGSATTSAIDTTGADLLVAVLTDYYYGCTVSDSKGNTWTPATAYQCFANQYIETRIVWCVPSSVGSAHTFTANVAAGSNSEIHILAFSGANASPWDTENGSGNDTQVGSRATGSITPAVDGSLIISAGTGNGDGAAWTNDGSLSQVDPLTYSGGCASTVGWKEQSTAAAINVTWTTNAGNWYLSTAIAAFKPAGGGGGPQSYSYTASGGIALAGTSALLRNTSRLAAGGITLAGTSAQVRKMSAGTAAGGLQLGGAATYSNHEAIRTVLASGGLSFSGAAGYSSFVFGTTLTPWVAGRLNIGHRAMLRR